MIAILLSAEMQASTHPSSQSSATIKLHRHGYEKHASSSSEALAHKSLSAYSSVSSIRKLAMQWQYEIGSMSAFIHLVYLCLVSTTFIRGTEASPKDIWHVSIWEAPAPPPGKGPPISASAIRDPSYLPAQISSIVGAYVFSLLVIGSAILFVGRRLRRAAQASPQSLAMEMMKPIKTDIPKAFDPSPISPAKSATLYGHTPESNVDMRINWPSPNNKNARNSGWGSIHKGHKKQAPSIQSSVVTFDESVIEDDRERNEREMERLYAAVMDHDEKKSASAVNLPDGSHPQSQNPPELQHLRSPKQGPFNPVSPPPRSDTKSPARAHTKSPRTSSRPTPLSLHSRNSSRSSFGSFSKKRGARNLVISPPMGSPDLIPDYNDGYGETEPLSPRIYDDPGPPPPTPPQQKAVKPREGMLSASRLSPQNARFPDQSLRAPRVPAFPGVQPIPESDRPIAISHDGSENLSQRDLTKPKRTPAPLALRTQALTNSSSRRSPLPQNQSQSTLQSAPLPLRQPHPTNYNSDRPPSMIKATVLERKAPACGLRTPAIGVPQTPYSPYMPFTPLTPMTPSRLVTREERKRKEKEEGRRVATIDDAVQEEPDMWGDAYP